MEEILFVFIVELLRWWLEEAYPAIQKFIRRIFDA